MVPVEKRTIRKRVVCAITEPGEEEIEARAMVPGKVDTLKNSKAMLTSMSSRSQARIIMTIWFSIGHFAYSSESTRTLPCLLHSS